MQKKQGKSNHRVLEPSYRSSNLETPNTVSSSTSSSSSSSSKKKEREREKIEMEPRKMETWTVMIDRTRSNSGQNWTRF